MKTNIITAALLVVLSLPTSAAVNIDWVTISDAGNAAQSAANRTHSSFNGDGLGSVAYTYRMSRNETTISQYVTFLNAVATTDPYNLYNPSMASDGNIAGISRSGSSGNYNYSVNGSGDRPITYVSWFDAARFANWMHNGQQTGGGAALTAETGAYTLSGAISGTAPARNVGATVWIPTENEWFKAAYYDPTKGGSGGYWLHANQSDSMTSNDFSVAGAANFRAGDYATTPGNNTYSSSQNYLTDVGAYGTDSQNYYGMNDMAGNAMEWNDVDGAASSYRGLRQGVWFHSEIELRSSSNSGDSASNEQVFHGFRLAAAAIPEPATGLLAFIGLFPLLSRRRK